MRSPGESFTGTERTKLAFAYGALHVQKSGDGPPLVLLHGGAGSWNHWVRNIGALAARFTVYALDLPGCGDSPDVPHDTSVARYFDHVAAALEPLASHLGPLNLAGFSFGAVTGAGVAARLGDRIVRLALLGPGGFGAPRGRAFGLRKVPFDGGDDIAIADALRHNLLVMMLNDPKNADAETIELHRRNVLRARFDSRRVSVGATMMSDLPRILCPLAIIWGEKDQVAYPSVRERAALCRRLAPQARLEIIPGAGHWVQYEAPEAVNRALLEFFTAGSAASRAAQENDRKPSHQ